MTKSSAFRSEMNFPFLSLTMTSMLTRLDLTLTTSSSCACAIDGSTRNRTRTKISRATAQRRNERPLAAEIFRCAVAPLREKLLKTHRYCMALPSPYTQRIGHAIDVVKPRSDECDLQDPLI